MSKEEEKDKFSLEKIGVLEGHGGAVTSLVCGAEEDGTPILISGSRDKSIIKWQTRIELAQMGNDAGIVGAAMMGKSCVDDGKNGK